MVYVDVSIQNLDRRDLWHTFEEEEKKKKKKKKKSYLFVTTEPNQMDSSPRCLQIISYTLQSYIAHLD